MKPIHGWMRALAALALALALGGGVAAAQVVKNEGFYDIEELRRLLEVARESGFTEQELHEVTIEDDGEFVKAAREAGFSEEEIARMTDGGDPTRLNVWGYLEVMEQRKQFAAEKLKAQREKVYLTVQDLFAEMDKKEPADLTRLREQLRVKE